MDTTISTLVFLVSRLLFHFSYTQQEQPRRPCGKFLYFPKYFNAPFGEAQILCPCLLLSCYRSSMQNMSPRKAQERCMHLQERVLPNDWNSKGTTKDTQPLPIHWHYTL